MLIGGEPGGGKSVALQLVVAHGALSPDCRLVLVDGKRVELGLWRALRATGSSARRSMTRSTPWAGCRHKIDERTDWLLDHKKRKITPDMGLPVYLVAVDEIAYFSATAGTPPEQKEFNARNRDVVARGRAPGIIAIEATQRPSADIIPTVAAGPVRLPVGVPLLHRSQLRHHPGPRLGVQGLHRRGHRPPGPRGVLAARRGRHPPPRQGRLPVRRRTSSPWPSRPPRCARTASLAPAQAARSSRSVRVMPHDPPATATAGGVYGRRNEHPPGRPRISNTSPPGWTCTAAGSGRPTTPSPTRPSRSASSPAGPATPCAARPGRGLTSPTGCSRRW